VILSLIPQPYRAVARLGVYVVVAFGLLGVGGYLGSRNEAARHAKTIAVYAGATAKAEADAHAAAIRIRETEAASAATIAALESQYLQELTNADRERVALLADLRAGRRALSLPFRTCPSVVPATGATATASGRSDGAGDSGAGDGRFVALADIEPKVADQRASSARADARHEACQATLIEYQRLTAEAAKARDTGSREPEGRGND
jgi:hypothetical protein